MNRHEVEVGYRQVQADLASMLQRLDGITTFIREPWEREGGGGGESWTLSGDGPVEKAAVNVSAVWGDTGVDAVTDGRFYATGVSVIVHPRVPHAPTFHANLRYFETDEAAWFGGGADLTPYYLFEEDGHHFHTVLRRVCDRHRVADYPEWKKECDEYFRLPHRGEARGIGGIFFDRQSDRPDATWELQQAVGAALVELYEPILARRMETPHDTDQVRWHELRRGRYAEFNLIWDRGTRFGLDSGGRTESVLASLPPRARWDETFRPGPGSPEEELLEFLRSPPRDWTT